MTVDSISTEASACDVVVIGAGPAGMAAATMTAEAGLSTAVIDENAAPGGQVYRAITFTPVKEPRVLGPEYWRGAGLADRLRASGARVVQGATVWHLDSELTVGIAKGGEARMLRARRVIIATGAMERPFPIPGWTLPGVMTAGAAQTILKTSGLAPTGRTIVAGLGPLPWLYAAQVLRIGGTIDALLDTTPLANYVAAARYLPGFLASPLSVKAARLIREVSAKVRVVRRVTALRAEGDTALRRIVYTTADGTEHRAEVDNLLLHQGVVPNVNLAMAAGVTHAWHPVQHCWSPVLDAFGGTNVPGIAVAGDGAGIAGADVAEERGRLAALAAIRALRPEAPADDEQLIRNRLARHARGRAFLDTLFEPPAQFRLPADDTIVCRCEEVTAGQIRSTVALGCVGPNQMKAFLRAGMGPCQGRLCGLTVSEVIAEACKTSPSEVGYYRLRPPVKPITLAELASLPVDDPATKAVVRI